MFVILNFTLIVNGRCSHVRGTIFRASYIYLQTKEINPVSKIKGVIAKSQNAKRNIANVTLVRKVVEWIVHVWDVLILLVRKIYGRTLDLIIVAVLIVALWIIIDIAITITIVHLEGFQLIWWVVIAVINKDIIRRKGLILIWFYRSSYKEKLCLRMLVTKIIKQLQLEILTLKN